MVERLLLLGLACFAGALHAAPISFFDVQFDTVAVASAGVVADVRDGMSPPDALPLLTEAEVTDGTNSAAASALAVTGFLGTGADAEAASAVASAVSSAHFSGSFSNAGVLHLTLGFNSIGFPIGDGFAAATLVVRLTSAGSTLIDDDVFTASEMRTYTFNLPHGTTSTLDLLLSSEASGTGAPGALNGGFNFGLLDFGGTVPAPPTPLLLLGGLCAVALCRRHAA